MPDAMMGIVIAHSPFTFAVASRLFRARRLSALSALVVVVIAVASAPACSLLTSTEDLTGGGDAGADHGADQAVIDGPSLEATSDAPSPPFCSTLSPAPALCEDFDGPSSFDARFTQTVVGSPNTIGSDDESFKSAPRSFFAHINSGANPNRAYAYMFKTFSTPSTRVSFGFDILLTDVVSGESTVAGGLVFDDGMPTQHALTFVASGVDAQLEESFATDGGKQYKDKALSAFPVVKKWSRVQIDVALSPPPARLTVTVDGTKALDGIALDSSWPVSAAVQINLGVTYVTSTAGTWLVRYDNVVVDPR